MTITLQKPPPTHREQTPVRECARCGCYLRTGNEEPVCTPCSHPPVLSEEEVFEHIARMPDVRQRRKAFEALAEMQAEKEAGEV